MTGGHSTHHGAQGNEIALAGFIFKYGKQNIKVILCQYAVKIKKQCVNFYYFAETNNIPHGHLLLKHLESSKRET